VLWGREWDFSLNQSLGEVRFEGLDDWEHGDFCVAFLKVHGGGSEQEIL